MADKIVLDKKWLYEEYFTKNRSILDIATELNVCSDTIRKNLIKHGYQPRDDRKNFKNLLTKEYLKEHYVIQGKFAEDIGRELGMRAETVRRYVLKHDLPLRDDRAGKFSKILTKEYLIEEYVNKGKTVSEIADQLNISLNTRTIIPRALNMYGIARHTERKRLREYKKYKGWKGCGELSGTLYHRYRRNAEKREIAFEVTPEYLWNLFNEQDGKCALSGVDIIFLPKEGRKIDGKLCTASLDRIDSSLGYIEGNVQWVHKTVNLMKMHIDQTEFISFCQKIATH